MDRHGVERLTGDPYEPFGRAVSASDRWSDSTLRHLTTTSTAIPRFLSVASRGNGVFRGSPLFYCPCHGTELRVFCDGEMPSEAELFWRQTGASSPEKSASSRLASARLSLTRSTLNLGVRFLG